MQQLAQRLKDGDETALKEIAQLEGKKAAQLLELLHDDHNAYVKAATVILKRYGNK